MGFRPDVVGLSGERITSTFEEPRPSVNCPHKGIDISSSKKAKAFTAGVFGKVSKPLGGTYGTVTVRPFSEPHTLIQYLHCSKISVKAGDVVAPWTTLGMTGKKAATEYHLHIHVWRPGKSKHACWKSGALERNFVDPESFPMLDVGKGTWDSETKDTWKRTILGHTFTYRRTTRRTLELSGASIGPGGELRLESRTTIDGYSQANDCKGTWTIQNVIQETNRLKVGITKAGCTCTQGPCQQQSGTLWLTVKGLKELQSTDNTTVEDFTRSSVLPPKIDGSELDDFFTTVDVFANSQHAYIGTQSSVSDTEDFNLLEVEP